MQTKKKNFGYVSLLKNSKRSKKNKVSQNSAKTTLSCYCHGCQPD